MSMSTSNSTKIPSFIDDAHCLCGLLDQRSSLPVNGEQIEMWRCIGDASGNINSGDNGKWFNTSLPSQELSGINLPQNWGENPPDLSEVFVLQNENGHSIYEKLGSGGSPSLIGADSGCTGKNDTQASAMFYARGSASSNSTSSSSNSSTSATSSASASGSASTSETATATSTPSASSSDTGPSTTASAAAPTGGPSSSTAPHFSLCSVLLLAMVAAPLVSMLG